MKTQILITAMVLAAALVGCGRCNAQSNPGPSVQNDIPIVPTPPTPVQVNGQRPDDYFSQFITCVHDCSWSLPFDVDDADSVVIGHDPTGRDIRAQADIYMHDDQTYTANYHEMTVYKYEDEGFSEGSSQSKAVSGRWSVQGSELVLEGFATATALIYNGRPALELTYTADIMTDGLNGQSVLVQRGIGNVGELGGNTQCQDYPKK